MIMYNYYSKIFKVSLIVIVILGLLIISALCMFSPELNQSLNGSVTTDKRISVNTADERLNGVSKIDKEISNKRTSGEMNRPFILTSAQDVHK
jgi:hypothetical protein